MLRKFLKEEVRTYAGAEQLNEQQLSSVVNGLEHYISEYLAEQIPEQIGNELDDSAQPWKYFPEAKFIWNGTWNDAQLEYKGQLYNENLIVDTLWERFTEYSEEEGIAPNEENFTVYCDNYQDEIRALFEIE
jgi:hypothetical protein